MHNILLMSDEARSAFIAMKSREEHKLAACCEPRDADIFWLRFERYFEDLYYPLIKVYGDYEDAIEQFRILFDHMVEAYAARPQALRLLDLERQFTPQWFQQPNMVGYTCYADLFADNLNGVREKISYFQELGITYLHLMPLLEPSPGLSDGGYAVKNYRKVNPELGTMSDLRQLANELHDCGISLCLDLVLNHTAKEHEWAQRAMAGEEEYLDYYYTFGDRTLPDAYEQTLPEIFPNDAPGNFTWYPQMASKGRWVWTTFNEFQWDLNYTNPTVFREMVDLMFFLANQGADVLRFDAIPFIWKRLGTNCQNQPEVFQLIQAFRAIMRVVAPGMILKAEAIVPPDALLQYLGVKSTVEKQCELAYNNQLMVVLWSSLATRNVSLMTQVFHDLPRTMIGCAFINYVGNHDDIGWAMTDEALAAVGENGFLHRQFLNQFYTDTYPDSFAKGTLFQFNPETKDARITGTTASLAGLEKALATGDSNKIDLAVRRILLLHSIILGFGGIPLIYMGDELGVLNDFSYLSDPLKAGDSRWIARSPMDWSKAAKRHDPNTVEGKIFQGLVHLIKVRKSTSLLHCFSYFQPMWTDNEHILAYCQKRAEGTLMVLANFQSTEQSVTAKMLEYGGLIGKIRNLLANNVSPIIANERIYLQAYETMWLVSDEFTLF
ncbi:alpha-amylase [Pleurocapsa sp. CCALA 161]|uniref:alpha-amylase family protein n=1 Tax=Pleurocapsa sp. CCALA 161 TaxID=2107688 RepID=UPI000D07926E|nr:alpha-amylase family protein [Pleurocapsa sp. CCALA 161]PSB11272.1 alpha-amylase [Pleurocapsa sp. CCALA 161]